MIGDVNQPWWPSGLICHVSNSSRDRQLGPKFESLSWRHIQIAWRHPWCFAHIENHTNKITINKVIKICCSVYHLIWFIAIYENFNLEMEMGRGMTIRVFTFLEDSLPLLTFGLRPNSAISVFLPWDRFIAALLGTDL